MNKMKKIFKRLEESKQSFRHQGKTGGRSRSVNQTRLTPLILGAAALIIPLTAKAGDAVDFNGGEKMSGTMNLANIDGTKNPGIAQGSGAAYPFTAQEMNLANIDGTKNPGVAQGSGATYPFTAQELWQKLLQLIEQPEGIVTKELVENIFGVSLVFNPKNMDSNTDLYYVLRKKGQWYFDLVFETHKVNGRPSFYFGWGQQSGSLFASVHRPPAGMCLGVSQLIPDIEQRGWKLVRSFKKSDRHPTEGKEYQKGEKGWLKIKNLPEKIDKDKCLVELAISSDFDLIR